jgi:phage terminase large subunit
MPDIVSSYLPTATQSVAHKAKNRYKLFGGAMGGGKTRWLCEEAKDLSMSYPGNRGVMCRWHLADFKNSTLKTLEECFPPEIIVSHNLAEHTITLINGSEIIYLGLSEAENVSKLKSMELGWFIIDEASEVPQDTFLLFQSRLRRRLFDGKFPPFFGLLASNPADCWLKDIFVLGQGGPDYIFIPSLPRDNPFLPSNYEAKLRESYPEDWVQRFLEGSWDDLSSGDMVIPGEWIRRAVNREIEIEDKKVVSADIARFGDDEIVIDYLLGNSLMEQDISNKQSLMETVGRIINKRKVHKAAILVIDDAALGGGVTDRLREMEERVMAINGGEKAINEEQFVNLKSETWWYTRELFEKGKVSIINDPILIRQLGAVKYHYRSNGKTVVEPKDEVKSRLGRSPDRADALVLGLWGAKHLLDSAKDFYRKYDANVRPMENPYGWKYHEGQSEVINYGYAK